MAKVVLGVVLGLAGTSLLIVSIWLLVDTENSKVPGLYIDRGNSPKIGAAAAGLLVICSILCFAINKVNLRRSLILTGVWIAFMLTVACCGIAIKNRLDVKQSEDTTREHMRRLGNQRYHGQNTLQIEEIFSKLKSQLVVMAVIAGLDAFVEIVAMITAYKWKEGYP